MTWISDRAGLTTAALGRRYRTQPAGHGRGPATAIPRPGPCVAAGCRETVDGLLCRRHWRTVPRPLINDLWRTWRSGHAARSPEHARAITAVIEAITTQEASR